MLGATDNTAGEAANGDDLEHSLKTERDDLEHSLETESDDLEHSLKTKSDDLADQLSASALASLERQNSRMVTEFAARKLEVEAARNWDIFYKRNSTNFFKDRHWTTREFQELLGQEEVESREGQEVNRRRVLLEVGCGVGNLVFPLLEEQEGGQGELYIYCCDFSARGVQHVKDHELYDEDRVKAFQCDITTEQLVAELGQDSVDMVSCVFVLSAIHPDLHQQVLANLTQVLRPGGRLLFRDYGVNDMAMIRFGPGSKIGENFYKRQDGTRSYFFQEQEIASLATAAGLEVYHNGFVSRRTVNKKEGVDVPRIFLQTKLLKPL